ncbi:flagellin-like protein [Candidatus Koribacter versatilis Ellin345]|uniref:Flagellin-like protein n=1 Tax=Koribacter versatilis (strain Ellin345) TaxID=204669 RepID=Q1IMG8_KORVE|nr:flagellar hook-associated protein FlgL [Candidatus Koribacter versatilis]ABF41932.1 flagellin-like protein [Candidatus Koribacter versatilis Ellin345]
MRVNPNQWSNILDTLNRLTEGENNAIREVSTGNRLSAPSDDPSAMTLLIRNRASQSDCDRYVQNIGSISASLQNADSALSNVTTSLNRAITLGLEGTGGTLSNANRSAIADEVSQIRDQVLALANTTFNGSYAFGGASTKTTPFVLDSTSVSGVRYQGDSTVEQVPIGDGSMVAANKPGDALFLNPAGSVFGALQGMISALRSGSGIDTATTTLRSAFDQFSSERVSYGSTISRLQADSNFQSSSKVQLQTEENSLTGVDMAQAISELTQAETARNAALSAAARIGQNSLLDYLR